MREFFLRKTGYTENKRRRTKRFKLINYSRVGKNKSEKLRESSSDIDEIISAHIRIIESLRM